MKKFKKIIALALSVMLIVGISALTATANGNDTVTVSLRIEGVESNLFYDKAVSIAEGTTVEKLLTDISGVGEAPEINVVDGTFGAYISEIDGVAEFEYGGFSGWNYIVNDISPTVGIGLYELVDGDAVVVYYGDPWGEAGMQYPVPDLSRLFIDDVIVITSVDTEYDENWNEIISINPVVGATVTFRGVTYITNGNGEITISNKTAVSGFRSLQIERNHEESGVPTVLRFAPDFEIYVPFADTPIGAWYNEAIMFCVREEYFFGKDLALNLFAPSSRMTMAELVTVLARIAGVDLTEPSNPWYATALEWAVENKIVEQYGFDSSATVTREAFIYMFYLTATIAGGYDMTVSADISDAVDYDNIDGEFLEAVSWAVASGIISGSTSNVLTINPSAEILRSQVCQMLFNYYNQARG
jgi:hypothetical protein